MNSTPLTTDQRNILHNLVAVRLLAKVMVRAHKTVRSNITLLEKLLDRAIRSGDIDAEFSTKKLLDSAKEHRLDLKFKIIEIGRQFSGLAHACDELPREVWLRALSVNESEWHTEDMQKYGENAMHVVAVLDLENSATVEDDIVFKPLKWCCTMAMMNATKTNPSLGKCMHDACNEMFGGVFGDWNEPSILHRLGAAH